MFKNIFLVLPLLLLSNIVVSDARYPVNEKSCSLVEGRVSLVKNLMRARYSERKGKLLRAKLN